MKEDCNIYALNDFLSSMDKEDKDDEEMEIVDSWGIAGGNYINIKYRICDTNLCATALIIDRMEEPMGIKNE